MSLRVKTSESVFNHRIVGDFGQMTPGPSYLSTGVTVVFTIVRSDATGVAVAPKAFPLSIYDLDNDESLRVVTSGYTWSRSAGTRVIRSGDTFRGDGTNGAEPSAASGLTAAQRSRSVTLTFTDRSSFEVVYTPGNSISLFSFAMEVAVPAECPPPPSPPPSPNNPPAAPPALPAPPGGCSYLAQLTAGRQPIEELAPSKTYCYELGPKKCVLAYRYHPNRVPVELQLCKVDGDECKVETHVCPSSPPSPPPSPMPTGPP